MTREQMITTLELLGYGPCRFIHTNGKHVLPREMIDLVGGAYVSVPWGAVRTEAIDLRFCQVTQ